MESQRHGQPQKRNADEERRGPAKEAVHPREAAHPKDADAKAEQASRSVMHPESFDPEWRYYHGAWG